MSEQPTPNKETLNLGQSIDEYETKIANAIHDACEEVFDLSIPDAIFKFLSELCSLSVNTEILSWNEIEWIYNNVIPNHCMIDKLYAVSPDIDEDENSFKKYDSYKFHDCVDEKGAHIFIIDCKHEKHDDDNDNDDDDNNNDNNASIIIGGYCDQSWFSPYKRNLEGRSGNCGWYIEGSVDSKLFVLRNNGLTKKLNTENLSLPLLAENLTTAEKIMVAANQDGPNFGYNHFYVTSRSTISTHSESRFFKSPIADVTFGEFMTYNSDEKQASDVNTYYYREQPHLIRMEVFVVKPIRSDE